MFPSTATSTTYLLLAAAALQGAYAAPIFNSRELASRAATQADGELAQGANFFFDSLSLESSCTFGQVACILNRFANRRDLAVCSSDGDWEVQPCFAEGTGCFAYPAPGDEEGINLQCLAESEAANLIAASGAEGGVSVDRGLTEIPSNADEGEDSDIPTEDPSETTSASEEEPTCTFDAPSETNIPTFEATLGEPFPTEIVSQTGSEEPTATVTDEPVCTPEPSDEPSDEPSSEEPTSSVEEGDPPAETTTLTLILIPDPTNSGEYITSTLSGDDVPTATESSEEPSSTEEATSSDEATSTAADEYTDIYSIPVVESSSASPTTTDTGPTTTIAPPVNAPPAPTRTSDINVIGPGVIPARRMLKVVKRA